MEVTPEYKIDLARKLRRRQTPSEAALWRCLRGHQLNGYGFRRQHPIGRFVADFCCDEARLVVEIDGGYHEDAQQQELDREREAHLIGRGYRILRVTVSDVLRDPASALDRIRAAIAETLP